MYTDEAGKSRFGEGEMDMRMFPFAPPAPEVGLSGFTSTTNLVFLRMPAGWYGEPHPAPRRQFIFGLQGEAEVVVSDGECRRFLPGSILLLEDITGEGHITRVPEGADAVMAIAQLPS